MKIWAINGEAHFVRDERNVAGHEPRFLRRKYGFEPYPRCTRNKSHEPISQCS